MRIADFILLLMVLGGGSVAVTAQNAESPETLIRRLYDNHQPWNRKEIISPKVSSPRSYQKILAGYFDEELTKLLIEDFKCAARTHEICRLDFDPILGGQDYDDQPKMNLKISKAGSSPNPSYKVTFNNLGPKTLIYRLRQTDQGWRVSDIVDGKSSLKALLRGRSD